MIIWVVFWAVCLLKFGLMQTLVIQTCIMSGKENSPNVMQRNSYVKIKTDRGFYDRNGKIIKTLDKPSKEMDSHIPLDKIDFNVVKKIMDISK